MHAVFEIGEHCKGKYSHIFISIYKGLKLSDPGLWDGQGTTHAPEKKNASTVFGRET
jgi:hypothetical protein